MAKYKIEKGIPIPAVINPSRKPDEFPFTEMRPGDSFAVPFTCEKERQQIQSRARSRFARLLRNKQLHSPSLRMVTRTEIAADGGKRLRIWVVEKEEEK